MKQLIADIHQIISPAYLVGGCVRDELMGLTPHDFDVATPLSPDEIEAKVKAAGKRAFTIGKRFGTIGFRHNGVFIEATTFRAEEYGKTRKPDVTFVDDLAADLSRRDFTINAIAFDGERYYDPFNGRADLRAGIIRAVGSPTRRFKEDPLRMLRAARFATQFGFTIEPATHTSMQKNAHSILRVSKERWMQELDKLIITDNAEAGIRTLAETGLLKFILPELALQIDYDQNSEYHELTLFEHSLRTMQGVPADKTLRWAALLHDIGKPFVRTSNAQGRSNYVFHDVMGKELVYGIAKRMKWSGERTEAVQQLVGHHMEDDSPLRMADNASKTKLPPQ